MTLIRQVSAPGSDIMWHNDTSLEKDKMLLCHLDVLYLSLGSGIFCNVQNVLSSSGWTGWPQIGPFFPSFPILYLTRCNVWQSSNIVVTNIVVTNIVVANIVVTNIVVTNIVVTNIVVTYIVVTRQRLELLVLCEKTRKWVLCQIFSSFVSEKWGRSNYKPDWQNQVTAASTISCFRSIYLHNIMFQTNLFAQYHVSNKFICTISCFEPIYWLIYLLRQDSSAQELF